VLNDSDIGTATLFVFGPLCVEPVSCFPRGSCCLTCETRESSPPPSSQRFFVWVGRPPPPNFLISLLPYYVVVVFLLQFFGKPSTQGSPFWLSPFFPGGFCFFTPQHDASLHGLAPSSFQERLGPKFHKSSNSRLPPPPRCLPRSDLP